MKTQKLVITEEYRVVAYAKPNNQFSPVMELDILIAHY